MATRWCGRFPAASRGFFDVGGKSTAYDSTPAAIAPHPWTLIPPEIEYTDCPAAGITALLPIGY